ncbi:PadR family transcriptional regulator [Corynebacterium kalidii]|uniref:PadR family transcriptional regulator n=1 Tax=Corynebacterium kalidii TaxID=2931982 RepID=A0A9X2B130_9CORY|nr:PadR family transcriptional regulator [Corynebacterium kalidii]
MTLRNALLALLSSGPMTGYDVAKRFASSVGFLWHAANSQIYPELRRLEKEGLLDTREVPWGSKGVTKTEYSINDLGLTALREWQAEPIVYVPDRDPARLKAAYFEMAAPGVAENNLREHISHFEAQQSLARDELNRIDAGTSPNLVRRLARTPEDRHCETIAFKRFAYEGRVARAEMEIAWARQGLELLRELGAAADPVVGDGDGPGPSDDASRE